MTDVELVSYLSILKKKITSKVTFISSFLFIFILICICNSSFDSEERGAGMILSVGSFESTSGRLLGGRLSHKLYVSNISFKRGWRFHSLLIFASRLLSLLPFHCHS